MSESDSGESDLPPGARFYAEYPCYNCAYAAMHCYHGKISEELEETESDDGGLTCLACQRAGLRCQALPNGLEVERIAQDLYALFHPHASPSARRAPFKFDTIAEYAGYLRGLLKKHYDYARVATKTGSSARPEADKQPLKTNLKRNDEHERPDDEHGHEPKKGDTTKPHNVVQEKKVKDVAQSGAAAALLAYLSPVAAPGFDESLLEGRRTGVYPSSSAAGDLKARKAQFREILNDARERFLEVINRLEECADLL